MKIFISHSSKDKDYGEALVELLISIGIPHDDIIFTSNPDYGVPKHKNIFDWLKAQTEEQLHVIYLLSPEYYESAACQNEMGAAWVIGNQHSFIFARRFNATDYEFTESGIDPRFIGFQILDRNRIIAVVEAICSGFKLEYSAAQLDKKVDKFLSNVACSIFYEFIWDYELEKSEVLRLLTDNSEPNGIISPDNIQLIEILNDIVTNEGKLYGDSKLKDYLTTKYSHKLDFSNHAHWFMILWYLAFRSEGFDSDENRYIYYRFLIFLFDENTNQCISLIEEESEFFNDIYNHNGRAKYVISFFSQYPFLYPYFKHGADISIQEYVDEVLEGKILAWFLSESYPAHLQMLETHLPQKNINSAYIYSVRSIVEMGIEKGYQKEVANFITKTFFQGTLSHVYTGAYSEIVKPNFDIFSEANLYDICHSLNYFEDPGIDYKADQYDPVLRDKIALKFPNFDFSKYPILFPED